MQVLESQMSGQCGSAGIKPELSVEDRMERCGARQQQLQSRYRALQHRINRLRAEKLGQNTRLLLGSVVSSCEKRRARQAGEPQLGGSSSSSLALHSPEPAKAGGGDPQQGGDQSGGQDGGKQRVRVKRYNKQRTTGLLGEVDSQLRHIQQSVDPDATDSSSGGESGDELDRFSEHAELFAPVEERAKFRWFARRAQLASQWVWLQAQVSDLEYKIRQHTELYRSQRLSKGPVQLGEDVVSWPLHAKLPTLPVLQDGALPLNCPPAGRGYQRGRAGEEGVGAGVEASSEDESTMTCCRVRPVKRVRRRKLVDTYGLHHVVAKAARLSSVECGCLHPGQWCVLCLGRRSHTEQLDRSLHSRAESVGLLDHSYHAVLTHARELPLNLALMESIANKRWLVRHQAGNPGSSGPAHLSRLTNINCKDKKDKKFKKESELNMKRKYIKRKDRESKAHRRKSRLDSDSRPESPVEGDEDFFRNLNIKSVRDGVERIRDKNSMLEQLRRKRKSSYDIDHIVIPMSMAATTRVEKLVYKEILTPSWKVVTDQQEAAPPQFELTTVSQPAVTLPKSQEESSQQECQQTTDQDEDFEDISYLAYTLRHMKAEEEERVRWATPLGRVHGGQRGHHAVSRGRGRRHDSCRTEASSGANTPNPLSPEAIEDIVVATRPSSPQQETPDTPDPPLALLSPSATPATPLSSVPASVRGRRRTSSQTKSRDRNLSEASQHSQESSRSTSPWTEVEERVEALPWEQRTFPLSDEDLKTLEVRHKLPMHCILTVCVGRLRRSGRCFPPPPPYSLRSLAPLCRRRQVAPQVGQLKSD